MIITLYEQLIYSMNATNKNGGKLLIEANTFLKVFLILLHITTLMLISSLV